MADRRNVLVGLAAAAFLAGCRAGQPPRSQPPVPVQGPAGLIYHNARVLTMEPAMPQAQAVAVTGELISAVGTDQDVMALRGAQTKVVDLGGRVLLPGFNDAHGHWIGDRNLAWGEPGPVHPAQPTASAAIQSALEVGLTSLSEMFVNQQRLDELRSLDSGGGAGLGLRVNAYLPVNYLADHFGYWFNAYVPGHEYSPYLRLAGAKMFIDRAGPSLMYLSEPHTDAPGFRGQMYWTQARLNDMMLTLLRDGWQIAAHSAGDGAHDMVLDAIAFANLTGARGPGRHRLEHLTVLRDDQLTRMRDLGVVASFQLTWVTSDWLALDWVESIAATLGPERVRWAGRWRDLLDANVRAAGGTDTPWTGATPLGAIHKAVTRVGYGGAAPTDWMLAQRITVAEALRLLTIDAAYATFQEEVKGSIRVGKFADLVVLSDDPMQVPVDAIPDIEVLVTMVGGRSRFCAARAGALCPV